MTGPPSLYDVTGDGRAEAFVTLQCVTPGGGRFEPAQLEVFAGDSDPAEPTRLAVIIGLSDKIALDTCVYFAGAGAMARATDGRTVAMATWVPKEPKPRITKAAAPLSSIKLPPCGDLKS
ncbi:hypothetical protein ACPCHT_02870 [Nucisporomicrobium flavum]|uniref:hypothetical protein n=1 Tax=Nucisporomicrobium flavum TaxID=2785915 RepID=UPI003C2F59F9